jgi:hypothetical protein
VLTARGREGRRDALGAGPWLATGPLNDESGQSDLALPAVGSNHQRMVALPLVMKAAMGIVLTASIWWAFFGPPPDRRDLGTAKLWGATAAILYLAGVYALLAGRGSAVVLVGAGIVALCLAFWHARGDDGGGGGWDDDDGDDDGPFDWDEFDRARGEWDRPAVGT